MLLTQISTEQILVYLQFYCLSSFGMAQKLIFEAVKKRVLPGQTGTSILGYLCRF